MKVLITGATGFLGKYIIEEFATHNCDIVAFGRNERVGNTLSDCQFIKGDFTRPDEICAALDGVDIVVHAGALCTVWGKWKDFYQANVVGTQNVLEACIAHGVKKFVYISSCSVYNCAYDRLDIHEDDVDTNNKLNDYIKSKIMAEKLVNDFGKKHGLSSIMIRPHGIFGIGDTSIVPRLLHANAKIGIPLFNRGKNVVDIVCVENVAYSIWLAANSCETGVFNITNGEVMKYKDIIDNLLEQINVHPRYFNMGFKLAFGIAAFLEFIYKILQIRKEPVFTRYTLSTLGVSQTLNIDAATKRLGYVPKKTLSEGFREYAQDWNENH
ncbi:dTDP-4-dehydrorhamnose 3,5-epimerase [Clostridia bacterium]|nr:dTDP-4-dehydrorhamnose 3,5-epimerase [Clostridia bacterium]